MGIELGSHDRFDARCDGCDTFAEIGSYSPGGAQVHLRDLGWRKADYIVQAHHYVWLCPKCKDKE